MMDFELIENNLINFEKPARYIGDEIGIPEKDFQNSNVKFVISYPDVYEIGMSNLGIKIIYDRINRLDFASCERVFSPWLDFEKYLLEKDIPLFSLETKTPLDNFDFIGFSIQYELLFSNFLNILKLGKISLLAGGRDENAPIILCGGPSIVNPAPYAPFADLFLIGEGEETIGPLLEKFRELKNKKCGRQARLKELSSIPGIYSPLYSNEKIRRQIYSGFCEDDGAVGGIIPNIDIIQNKLVVEIMRGCPNKCRFCQAGVIYKPYRERNADRIINIIDDGIKKTGANEITLSSLSSGDYSQIINLTEYFTNKYSRYNISFSLPSIKVETFDVNLLEKISSVRKSGLTFAIESGTEEGQLSINKIVLIDKIKNIIEYALKHGWKLVKFYFMIGLPGQTNEPEDIIKFIDNILSLYSRININLNVAVFVPKPHTPFQYEKQLSLEESIAAIDKIEAHYRRTRVRVKKHDPHMSYIEGFVSRGDEKTGLAMLEAFNNGARFDGWDDHFNFEIYRNAFSKFGINYGEYLSKKDTNARLPWDMIDTGLSKDYFLKELDNSAKRILTKSCKDECERECSICGGEIQKNVSKDFDGKITDAEYKIDAVPARFILEFSKTNLIKYIGHIDILTYFEKLFLRSGVKISYSQGFNPHPKIQFSSALSLGIESKCEIMEFHTLNDYSENELLKILKSAEHRDISINRLKKIKYDKKISLIEMIDFTDYSIGFKKQYHDKAAGTLENYNSIKTNYSFDKKGKTITGIYQDYIELLTVNETSIMLRIKKMSNVPKVAQFAADLLKGIPVKIIKEKIWLFKNGQPIELFNLIN